MEGPVRECFLSGVTSEQTMIHQLHVFDPYTRSGDDVFISDMCYRIICNSDDNEVAKMWKAWKQAYSSGYTDIGFLSQVEKELEEIRCKLMLIYVRPQMIPYLLAYTMPLSEAGGDLRLWCRSFQPVPHKMERVAQHSLGYREVSPSPDIPWIENRFLIASDPSRKEVAYASPPWNRALYEFAIKQCGYGDPPDLFSYLANNATAGGYEIIRRALLIQP